MKELVPIRIVIGTRLAEDGTMPLSYPNFNQLPLALRGNMDWSYFIDRRGYGMHYSRQSSADNKPACCWTLVPKDFAVAAAKAFAEVTIHSEKQWAAFYDKDCKALDATEHLDNNKLQGILARVQLEKLGMAPKPSLKILELRKQCLDPEYELTGITHNCRKTWAEAKILDDIKVIDI